MKSESGKKHRKWFGDEDMGMVDYYQKVLFCRPNYNGFKHLCVVIIFI